MLHIEVKNRFAACDRLEVLTPAGVHPLPVSRILREDTGEEIPVVTVAGTRVLVPESFAAGAGDFVRSPVR